MKELKTHYEGFLRIRAEFTLLPCGLQYGTEGRYLITKVIERVSCKRCLRVMKAWEFPDRGAIFSREALILVE